MQHHSAIASQTDGGQLTTEARPPAEARPARRRAGRHGVVLLLFVLCCLSVKLNAQAEIYLRAFHAGDSVMLRWIPVSYATWQAGNANGYRITRFGMDEYLDSDGQSLAGKGTVIAESIKPLPKNDTVWNQLQRRIPSASFVYASLYVLSKPVADPQKRRQQEQIAYGFSLKVCDDHPEAAKAAGLFFTDHTSKKGERYVYRIEILNTPFAAIVTADEKLSVLHVVENPDGKFRNRSMRLTFDVSKTREEYAGYIIERSTDSVHFSRINTELLSFVQSQYETVKHELVYEDSIPENGKLYWYRVRGYSYFGITGPPSAVVRGKGKEEWNAYPVPDTSYSPDNKVVMMQWSLPALSGETGLKAVCVLRSDRVNGKYLPVATVISGRTFTDTAAKFTNYYMLGAISTEGDTAFSFPFLMQLQDNTPPAVPHNVSGVIDTNGVVLLSWTAVSDERLKGYRVFRCNTLREEFVEVTDSVIAGTVFTDTVTLQTLTRDVYYSVRSVDHVWNNSGFSAPVLLKRPDKIAPVAPLVKAIYHTDSTVVLSWINSSSDDVAMKKLIRKSPAGAVVLRTFAGRDTTSSFIDTSAAYGIIYTYTLIAQDSSGNQSVLNFPEMNFSPRIRPALKNCTATPDFEKRTIALNWELPPQPVDRIIIYKGKEGEATRTFKTLSGATDRYIDNQLYPGNTYIYKVKAVLKDGAETRMVEIKVVF